MWQHVNTVVFDYGNTLIEFGPQQMATQFRVLADSFRRHFGRCDVARLKAVRDRQIVAPYRDGYRENNVREIAAELVRGVTGHEASAAEIEAFVTARYRAFMDCAVLGEGVLDVLDTLALRYRLAMITNYPCARSIRDSLAANGLTTRLCALVISGEVGYVKPHPEPFRQLLAQLAAAPAECVFVGDNWLADVQGAKQAGMQAVLLRQYTPYERFDPAPGDHPPDAVLQRLDELPALLGMTRDTV